MKSIFRFGLVAGIVVLVLYACTFPPTATQPVQPPPDGLPALGLAVQATNATNVFNTVGQVINYSYTVTNTGNAPLAGPVTVTDDKTTAPVCAATNDANLDRGETVTCTSTYPITQADLNTGTVTNNSTARAGSTDSNRVTTVVRMAEVKVLALTVVANPTTYSAAGQSITLTYTIKNTGTTALGPTQFIVRDDHITAPINCDVPNRTLGPGESITCAPATYVTTQNDMGVNQFITTATASGGGAGSIQPATSTFTKTGAPPPPPTTPPPSGNLTPGTTVTYTMKEGEWLMQVLRCYGKDPGEVYAPAFRAANPQIFNPNFVKAGTVVTIPNIGSKGTIYYPNCFTRHSVVSGDSWETIGSKYNAAVDVLKAANRNVSFGNGVCLKIPLNSAGGTSVSAPSIAPCAGGTNPPPPPSAIRITFPAGGTSATLSGTVQPTGSVKYVFTANQGQLLSVKLNAPANEVSLGITAPNGSTLKTQDTTLTFSGTIPATGDSFIDIKGVSGSSSKSYTLEISITNPPVSSPVERVADINTGINNSDPAYLSVFNNTLYFKATGSDNAGGELWKYDPATKTASRVSDIFAGATGSDPAYLTVFSNALYFKANGNDGAGAELWRFNGSASGRLTDINSGAGDANPAYLAVLGPNLYFSAKGGDGAGVELWKTDGTTAVRAADINAGPGDSNPSYLTFFKDALYFSAVSTDGAGVELWKFDGTTATRVADINPGVGNSNPAHLAVFNNALYFSANANDGKGIELWKFDGTTATLVADLNSGTGDSVPSFLTVFPVPVGANSALYFSANGNDGSGNELWKYDGTTSKRVSDINTAGNSNPSYLAVFNNELYFQANSNDGTGTELWKFKGP